MANYHSHTKTRKRTYEYPQINQAIINFYVYAPLNTEIRIFWESRSGEKIEYTLRRNVESVFIYNENDYGHHIYFTQTDLTFGKRTWYLCPACKKRVGVLYFTKIFSCRHCRNPAYQCQNGSQLDYLATRIITLRKRLWGRHQPNVNEIGMRSWYWEKPPYIHWERYMREKTKIMMLENKRTEIWLNGVYHQFPHFKKFVNN